jgi:xylulose-5-phosphate/fructose-6-phosphate phosphoketolase
LATFVIHSFENSRPEHVKPRLLGHWGTSPGLSLIYVHLNRMIREPDANVIYLAGPGHGGPALVGLAYLEGTYTEVYPDVTQDVAGMRLLCRRFSTPGGVPSHVSVQTPGSARPASARAQSRTSAVPTAARGVSP